MIELFGSWLWGGLGLAMTIIVLCYSMGRGEFNTHLSHYAQEWAAEGRDRAMLGLQCLDDPLSLDPDDSDRKAHQKALSVMLVSALRRLFCTLFWFVIVGVEAALLYRLICLLIDENAGSEAVFDPIEHAFKDQFLVSLRDVLEWPAARLLALGFVIGRHGAAVWRVWLQCALTNADHNAAVLRRCFVASLGDRDVFLDESFSGVSADAGNTVNTTSSENDADQLTPEQVAEQTQRLQLLLNRSLIQLLVLSALFMLAS